MASSQSMPPQSSLARGHKLNPIIEEDSDDGLYQLAKVTRQARRQDTSHLKIEAWLSPMSDHFPTPRGVHYLAAPILPSSPSASSAGNTSPTNSSNAWNRMSVGTQNTEFEDLYDVSDDEKSGPSKALAKEPAPRPQYIRIEPLDKEGIPPSLEDIKTSAVALPPTPSVNLPMSPAQMNFMDQQQALEVPTLSAPPSLDGSLSSEQLATMSAPPTPVEGDEEDPAKSAWEGVQLQPDALRTLQALSGSDQSSRESISEFTPVQPAQPATEMQQQSLRMLSSIRPSVAPRTARLSSNLRDSLAELTKLDIPSPEGFFDSLSPRTKVTWQAAIQSPEAMAPPTSTTAEQFYRCPWNSETSVPPVPRLSDFAEDFYRSSAASSSPVEQVVEIPEDLSEDMPTARPILHQAPEMSAPSPISPQSEDIPIEIVIDFDPTYARKQQEEALSNLDRTELWLLAQRSYLDVAGDKVIDDSILATIDESPESDDAGDKKLLDAVLAPAPAIASELGLDKAAGKKTVRFSDLISTTAQPKKLPSKLVRQESAYYRAFLDYFVRAHGTDAFIHQLARFEALQAQRISLRESHRNQLLGKYQLSVVPQSAKKRLSTNVARGDDMLTDDFEKLRQEKEFEAASQMAMPTWHVAAMKFLNGGRLVTAPVTKRLARLSQMAPGQDGVTRDRARILDLGGQSTCDWAWHCALQYPNTKVYTVTTKAVRQLSNSNIRGPSNHRQVAVDRLTRLPFGDNQFDLVYARELHSILKFVGENGEDEWEACLRECMRVLKPGGYIEFSVLDSEIMNAGPLGHAKSVEFGFSLKTLGYDPNPTKLWLGRLNRAGFSDVRRAWQCLPLGPKRNINTCGLSLPAEAPEMGSSDGIAGVASIVGGWNWERWLLRCEMEKVSGEMRLADTVTAGAAMEEAGQCLNGVAAVVEEGRNCGSGFRMLTGYARKASS